MWTCRVTFMYTPTPLSRGACFASFSRNNLWGTLWLSYAGSSTGNSFIQCWSASGFPLFSSPYILGGLNLCYFYAIPKALFLLWHYLVDLLVYLESSSFYKVHFWFWPRFMLKNSVIVESRTETCPLSETTKFSERFSQFICSFPKKTLLVSTKHVYFFFVP